MPSSKSVTPSTASKPSQKRAAAPAAKSPAAAHPARATAPASKTAPITKTAPVTRAATPSASATQGRSSRQARAWQRAEERRRRTLTNWSVLGVLVAIVLIVFLVIKQPWTGLFSSHTTTASPCPAATATAIGPVPAITPPAAPPDVKGATKTTGDGLKEVDIQVGCGAVAQAGQTVIVEYTGWIQSTGKLFDSSFEHPPTACNGTVANTCGFALSQSSIIQGWVEGIAGMKIGGTRRLIIPPALGYGAQGSPPTIPANATLIFDITLVGIQG